MSTSTLLKERIRQLHLGQKFFLSEDVAVETDPQLLFQRLCVLSTKEPSTQQQQEHFQYELCGYPPALFDSFGLLREAKKPASEDAIWELTSHVQSGPVFRSTVFLRWWSTSSMPPIAKRLQI